MQDYISHPTHRVKKNKTAREQKRVPDVSPLLVEGPADTILGLYVLVCTSNVCVRRTQVTDVRYG